eukprot:3659115-Alexandrium_andersonii.AAC.1
MIAKVQEPGARVFPVSFKDSTPDLQGVCWDYRAGRIKGQSIHQWLNENSPFNYLNVTLILIGGSGAGKS